MPSNNCKIIRNIGDPVQIQESAGDGRQKLHLAGTGGTGGSTLRERGWGRPPGLRGVRTRRESSAHPMHMAPHWVILPGSSRQAPDPWGHARGGREGGDIKFTSLGWKFPAGTRSRWPHMTRVVISTWYCWCCREPGCFWTQTETVTFCILVVRHSHLRNPSINMHNACLVYC